ncbi:hypothetical protein [Sodalis sp. RH16]|uniref:hypothetical protein n=1 Tax=Sodalis sp. RH16 TaxID=3394331 RepID=UPI0039B5E305
MVDIVADIATLRTTEPATAQQLDYVTKYASGSSAGGGFFQYDSSDSTSNDDGGSIIITTSGKRWKRKSKQLIPAHFGCDPAGVIDCTSKFKNYISASVGRPVDIRGGSWLISDTIDFSRCTQIIADSKSKIIVDVINFSGEDGSYAVTIGTPGASGSGRVAGFGIKGFLLIQSNSRIRQIHGIYLKGSWLNIDHVRSTGFNGYCINCDSVWDSTIIRLSAEIGGSTSYAQIRIDSDGDTTNASHIISLQSEQAYHRALEVNVLRTVIDNIHAERTYNLQDNTSTTGWNVYLNLGNSSINNTTMDCNNSVITAPDGTPIFNQNHRLSLSLDYSSIIDMNAGNVSHMFGRSGKVSRLYCNKYGENANSDTVDTQVDLLSCSGQVTLGNKTSITRLVADILDFGYNSSAVTVLSGTVNTVLQSNNILGDIVLSGLFITNGLTSLKSQVAGYSPTVFKDCHMASLVGSAGGSIKIIGGYVASANLVSYAKVEMEGVKGTTFNYTGTPVFVTRGCRFDTVTAWSSPQGAWPVGTVTERMGIINSGDGVIFRSNNATSASWITLLSAP